jgi:hypothetical protein
VSISVPALTPPGGHRSRSVVRFVNMHPHNVALSVTEDCEPKTVGVSTGISGLGRPDVDHASVFADGDGLELGPRLMRGSPPERRTSLRMGRFDLSADGGMVTGEIVRPV